MSNKQDVLPKLFVYRLHDLVPAADINTVLSAFTAKRPTTIRANTLKITARDLRNAMFDAGVKLENVLWYRDAFIVKNRTLRELTEMEIDPQELRTSEPFFSDTSTLPRFQNDMAKYQRKRASDRSELSSVFKKDSSGSSSKEKNKVNLYKEGYFYVQSLSSMVPALLLDPKPGEKVLDITAAPGSKTTQMAMMMGNTGKIVANDSSRVRLYKLEANLRIQGVKNVSISNMPAEGVWKAYPEFFDKVLVDVPCSMEGRFATYEPDTYKGWSVAKVKNLSHLQKWILRSAVSCCKVGGRIIYSTCTLSPEENEEVIDWILEKEEGNVKVEDFSRLSGTPPMAWAMVNLKYSNGITEWEGKTYHPSVTKTARILPSATMEGFFIAVLKKVKSNVRFGTAS